MKLQETSKLKQDLYKIYIHNNLGEIMSYQSDLSKILNDFNLANSVKIDSQTYDELIKLKEQAKANLDIEKVIEINKKIEENNLANQ